MRCFERIHFTRNLRTHKLKGHLERFWAYSVSDAIRVLFRFLDEHTVLYYDIGPHDIYR